MTLVARFADGTIRLDGDLDPAAADALPVAFDDRSGTLRAPAHRYAALRDALDAAGIDYEDRVFDLPTLDLSTTYDLRNYQSAALAAWTDADRRGILELPTGSGKTVGTMLEVLRSFQVDRGIDIRILDPKPDYGRLVELLGGETCVVDEVDLESYEPGSVCRYVVDDPSRDNSERLVETVRHIHRECCTDDRKCLVVVDEAHRLLKISEGADALSRLVWEGRSSSVGVSLLTQNAEDLTQSVAGRNILRNTGCYIFMRHQSVETEAIDFFDLSEAESAELHNLATGSNAGFSQGLVRGPVNTTLCIEMDERESEELID